MFKGQYRHNLDDKSRLVLPAEYRESLGEGAVITKGYDGCLVIYTKKGFDEYQDKLLSLPTTSITVRKHVRVLLGNAKDVELDKSGRILIPDYLREDASITKDVTIVGVGQTIEVWDTERWNKELAEGEEEFEDIAEQLFQIQREGNK